MKHRDFSKGHQVWALMLGFTQRNSTNHLDHFQHYFPQLYDYYFNAIEDICSEFPECHLPFQQLPFAQYTMNVGKKSVCRVHLDGSNIAAGLCMACPLGSFDYKKGGHLILHELKLILEVPAGSIALFPSALVAHENIPIQPGETRQAITAFTSANLFQYRDNGFESVPKDRTKAEMEAEGDAVWAEGLARFPHVSQWLSL
jgi:hypothetical protein